jgi:FkbM family methyltransferase
MVEMTMRVTLSKQLRAAISRLLRKLENARPRVTPDHKQVLDALQRLSPKKRALVIEALIPEGTMSGETPEGARVTARTPKELWRFTRRDPRVVEWMQGFEAGDVFYDIGANVGGMTLAAAAMHGDRIRIVAIEPSFASFESLTRNLSLNGFLSFTIPLQVALLDRTGLEPMNYQSIAAGTALHGVGEAVDHLGHRFTPVEVQMVPTFKLDDLIEILKLPAPTRIKCDVDGYEGCVLRGATRTLAAGTVSEIVIEVVNHDAAGTRLKSVADLLGAYGYEIAKTFQHATPGSEDESCVADYLFQRRDSVHAACFSALSMASARN